MTYILLAIILLSVTVVFAQERAPADLKNLRTAKGQVIESPEMPKLKLEFAKNFKYAGGHSFILYNVARAEQHFYVDADKNGNVSRMYWVQFEGYLPDNTHSYDYKSPRTVNISGLDFFADAYARKIDPTQGRPDSDGNKARAFLLSKGYKMGSDEVMMQRLVNMIDKENRNELMIIYLETLTPHGVTAADLAPNGKDNSKWAGISEGLLQRAQNGMKIIR